MKSYSLKIFSSASVQYLRHATALIDWLPSSLVMSPLERRLVDVRCHELARAVGKVLDLVVVDGKYGAVDHSWLVTHRGPDGTAEEVQTLTILDVYAVGRLPQVQLVSVESLLPHNMYWVGRSMSGVWTRFPERTDIDEGFVQEIVAYWRDHE